MNTCCENIQKFYGIDSKVYSVHVHSAPKMFWNHWKASFSKINYKLNVTMDY